MRTLLNRPVIGLTAALRQAGKVATLTAVFWAFWFVCLVFPFPRYDVTYDAVGVSERVVARAVWAHFGAQIEEFAVTPSSSDGAVQSVHVRFRVQQRSIEFLKQMRALDQSIRDSGGNPHSLRYRTVLVAHFWTALLISSALAWYLVMRLPQQASHSGARMFSPEWRPSLPAVQRFAYRALVLASTIMCLDLGWQMTQLAKLG